DRVVSHSSHLHHLRDIPLGFIFFKPVIIKDKGEILKQFSPAKFKVADPPQTRIGGRCKGIDEVQECRWMACPKYAFSSCNLFPRAQFVFVLLLWTPQI